MAPALIVAFQHNQAFRSNNSIRNGRSEEPWRALREESFGLFARFARAHCYAAFAASNWELRLLWGMHLALRCCLVSGGGQLMG
jgi:hypothetical protein